MQRQHTLLKEVHLCSWERVKQKSSSLVDLGFQALFFLPSELIKTFYTLINSSVVHTIFKAKIIKEGECFCPEILKY